MLLDAIGMVSQDLEKTKEFYSFFELKFEMTGGPEHWECTLESGTRLMIDSLKLIKEINPNWKEVSNSNLILCFKQESSQQVDSLARKLKDNGFELVKEPWDAFWGQRYCSVKDPDGNQVDIFSDLS